MKIGFLISADGRRLGMSSWEVMWVEALQRLLLEAELLMVGGVLWCGVFFWGSGRNKKVIVMGIVLTLK